MKCYHCNEEIIWGNDFDIEEENDEYSILSVLHCPNCDALHEVYYPRKNLEGNDEGQD
jgi:RNase P subunit RPR2